MSLTQTPQSPMEKRYGFAQQSALGTAVADNAGFTEIDCDHFEINRSVVEIENPGAHGTRNETDSNYIHHTKGIMPVFTVSSNANRGTISDFLYAAYQNVSEGAATVYAKTFTFLDTQPDFEAYNATTDVGYLATWIERDPASSKSIKAVDCIAKSTTLIWAPATPVRISQEWVGRGLASITSNPSGTWTRTTNGTNLFWQEDVGTVTIGGTSYRLVGAEISINHDIRPVGQDGSGNFAHFGIVGRKVGYKIKVIKDADWEANLSNWSGDTAVAFEVSIGNGTAAGDLDVTWRGKVSAPVKVDDPVWSCELSGPCIANDANSVEPLQIIVGDSRLTSWATT